MRNKKIQKFHYLSLTYNILINNEIIHCILFFLEMLIILLQILEIYINNFKLIFNEQLIIYNPLTKLMLKINKLPTLVKFIIYLIINFILIISFIIFNCFRLKENILMKIMVNITNLLFYRLLSLLIFDYLLLFDNIYFFIGLIFAFLFVMVLILTFYKNNLYLFFPNLISYPYDQFSMIIDLHLLIVKICLSFSTMTSDEQICEFCFILSIFILMVLLFYLSYIAIKKSYYLMNNCKLNKIRYAIILCFCIIILFIILIGKKNVFNIYYIICYVNIFDICLLLVLNFYDPYQFCKFGKDDNLENIYYYFFILDRNKNKNFLLEIKIREHMEKCSRCNLCKKYNNINIKDKGEIDLYYIISNGKIKVYNLLNNILRSIKKNKRKSFVNNSYYLINLIYLYNLCINMKYYNILSNLDLLFEIINLENTQILEEYKLSLNKILYANDFCFQANNIINVFYEFFDQKSQDKKTKYFLDLSELINNLKYKEFKPNNNNNGNIIEGLPNCNYLLTISSLFYEELFNESISNSGIYTRESPNLLEDLVNNIYKSLKQITLEINISNFKANIIRAGGYMNKYENSNLFDIFPSLVKYRQILEMKNILLDSNENSLINSDKNKKTKKDKITYNLNFNFIIQEKEEDNNIFNRYLKLKMNYIFLSNIDVIIYLNGVYSLDKDIILTEKRDNEEIVLHFGNKEQMEYVLKNKIYKNYNIFISKAKNGHYLGKKKLIKDTNVFTQCKKYNVYHFLIDSKKSENENENENINNNIRKYYNDINSVKKNNSFVENDELYDFNDIASQSSSNPSYVSRNHLAYNNKANKKTKNKDDILKKFNFTKYILFLSLLIFLIFIILQNSYLFGSYEALLSSHNYFLLFFDYSCIFDTLFFSILSLLCIADSPNSTNCFNIFVEMTNIALSLKNVSYNYDFRNITLVNFTELIFAQNEILYKNLNSKLDQIVEYLSLIDDNNNFNFLEEMDENLKHFKINKNYQKNNDFMISLSKEKISFLDFVLLVSSRYGIILSNINNIYSPIYILNKTGDEAFNNFCSKGNLNSYQENIYLMILDYNIFVSNIDFFLFKVNNNNIKENEKMKKYIFIFFTLNLLFLVLIIILIFGFMSLYFIAIYIIINNIYNNLKEKSGENLIEDIFRKKIDNLKLILMFYENDINATLENINKIYNNFRDKYNAKIKEEYKLMRNAGKNELEKNKNKFSCKKFFNILKNYKLYNFSKRGNIYYLTLLFIIIISLSIYIMNIILWSILFKEQNIIYNWVNISKDFGINTNRLMNNFLLMIFNNQTLDDLSETVEEKDYIKYVFTKLTNLYEGDKYFNLLGNFESINDKNIIYDCLLYYKNINNEIFNSLRNKFINKEKDFYNTMQFFCNWSGIMKFKKYKTIFLQLFNQIKLYMENFNYNEYNNIIQFFYQNQIIQIEVIFLITDIYLIDILKENIKLFILAILAKIRKYLIISFTSFILILIILVIDILFIYIRNVDNDCKKFILIQKVFKICNTNE